MEISLKMEILLFMVLLCTVIPTRGVLDNSLATEDSCPDQCTCSSNEILCPGATNITDVLNNYGIDHQVLHIDFSNTKLTFIPQALTFMANCKKLNLSTNKIQTIEKFALQNLWNLEELILNDNTIMDIADINPNYLIYNNNNMKVLNLSNNLFTDLGRHPNMTLYSESLEVLDVSKCRITSLVGPIVLSGLKKLAYLNLSNNPLTRLDSLYSSTLKVLNVRGCFLSQLKENALIGLQNLEILDASLNDQLYVNNAVNSPTLKSIDLSMCSVHKPNMHGMTELRSAFLNGNRIRRLTAYQFVNNTNLFTLDLSRNNVESVDPLAFYGMTSLLYLDLSANMITDIVWEALMAPLPSLEILNLSFNYITQIMVLESQTLRRFDLSHCWIQTVPSGAFALLSQLTELNLSNNPLHTLLPGSLNATWLSMLDLSFCRISQLISYEFVNMPNLTEIKLTGNRLVTLKKGTFSKCLKLKYIYLDDNPWRCDCYSVDFAYMALLANKTIRRSIIDSPCCLSPDNVTGVPWHVACVNSTAYGRPDNRKNFSMAVGVILILCVSGLMAIFVAVHENMRTRQAMRRRRHLDDRSDGGGGDGGGEYFDDYLAESVRKLSQLPSYDEAIMLPKPSEPNWSKRHSCTQTDAADAAVAVAALANRPSGPYAEATAAAAAAAAEDRYLSPHSVVRQHHVTQL